MSQTVEKDAPAAGVSPSRMSVANIVSLSLREPDRAALRPLVAEIEKELETLRARPDAQSYAEASARFVEHWQRLVKIMALGTAPELRPCPHCGHGINAIATRCIQCWKKSPARSPA